MKALLATFCVIFTMSVMADDREIEAKAIASLKESAQKLAAQDRRCEIDSDCSVIAMGKRACGGPSGFLIASRNNANYDEINYLADRSIEKEAEFNRKYRVISICSIARPPQAKCFRKQCR